MRILDSKSQSRYFLSVDGLRLIASFNIVLFHLEYIGGFTELGGSPGWFFRFVKGPVFHASLFFLLGGFIFYTKFSSTAQTFRLWPFILKRLKELYPLHLITTCIMIILEVVRQNIDGSINVGRLAYSAFMHLSFLWSLFPFNGYSLNGPSWALSAFFLCYLLFGFLLRFVNSLSSNIPILGSIIVCIILISIWNAVYAYIGAPSELFQFFHIFAPIRVFEFAIGMLLARLFQFNPQSKQNHWTVHILSDLILVILFFLLYQVVGKQLSASPSMTFFSYHVFVLFFFILILYIIAKEKGIIAWILALAPIRKIGRSSFYPYLLHIPLISWITFISEYFFHEKKLLHKSVNIWIFVATIYIFSYIYITFLKKPRQKKSQVQTIPEPIQPILRETPESQV